MPSPAQFTLEKLFDLNGLIALVSGGGTGIRLMIAQGLPANGARASISPGVVSTSSKTLSHPGTTTRKIPWAPSSREISLAPSVACFQRRLLDHRLQMDVTNKDDIQRAVKKLRDDEGKLHILVNKCRSVLLLLANS